MAHPPSLICVQMCSYYDPRCFYEDFFPAGFLFYNVPKRERVARC